MLAAGVAVGVLGSAVLMMVWMGPRPDLMAAMGQFHFWMKFLFTLSLAGLGLWLVERMGRPGTSAAMPALLLAVPLAAIAALAVMQLMPARPGNETMALINGHSRDVCPFNILMISLPVLVGTLLTLRALAPTRLALAGAGAGLFAGATGAFVYAFHCNESAAPFVALWYTAGILLSTVSGAVLGRWVLRW